MPSIVHLYPTCHQKVEHPSQRSPAIGFSKLIIRNSYRKNLPKVKESVRIIVYFKESVKILSKYVSSGECPQDKIARLQQAIDNGNENIINSVTDEIECLGIIGGKD